jgi:choline-sulfatase
VARPLRYGFILAIVALCAGLAAAGGWRYARASSPVNGPIILISVESLRADHLTAYGYKDAHTPALDLLATDGIVFERAYAHSPETLPSHASLLTGRLPVDTGVRGNAGFVVKDAERLLAEHLRDRGYATGAVVSNFALRKASGLSQGFTFFDDKMDPAAPDMTIGDFARDGEEAERVAEQWLDANGSSRCFLFLQLNEPQAPYIPPSRFLERLPYDGEVAYADEIIGRLLKYLKTHQLYDRSTILVTADHGEGLGDHGEQGHGLFVYEEALRVPLIVKQAAGEGAGRRVPDLVEHVDIVPTLLDLAKAPDPGNLRGQSLKPLLDGTGHITGRTAYAESLFGRYHFGWHGLATVTDGHFRYISAPREELYDVEHDPGETHNIAADPARLSTLTTLRAALDRLKHDPQAASSVADDDRERFEALGDVGQALPGPAQGGTVDPKDAYEVLLAYRTAAELALSRQWPKAIARLETIVRRDPSQADVWREIALYASRLGRNDQAVDAYMRVLALEPGDVNAHLGAAAGLLRLRRLDEAREHAHQADMLASDSDVLSRSSAHEWLARIALLKHDSAAAREEAVLAKDADPTLPMPLYVDARVLYDQAHYADALPLFEQAVAAAHKAHARPIADLHYYLADTLIREQRPQNAENELLDELKAFPQNTRARAALATLEHTAGRDDDVEAVMDDLVRISPTADTYTLSARLWSSFGDRKRAADARAEALRLSAAY